MVRNPFSPYPSTRGFAKIFIYGDQGTYKTRRAMEMPKPLAIVDMEGGACDYQDLAGPDDLYLSTKTVKQVEEAITWIEENPGKVATLMVDPITVVWQQLQQGHILRVLKRGWVWSGDTKMPITEPEEVNFSVGDWNKLKNRHNNIMTRLLNLPCHVVLIARGMDKIGPDGKVKGYGWEGEKTIAFLSKIVIESRLNGDSVIKDRFTNKYADKTKIDGRVDLRTFVEAAGKGGARLQLEDEAARADAANQKEEYRKVWAAALGKGEDAARILKKHGAIWTREGITFIPPESIEGALKALKEVKKKEKNQ